MLDGLTPFKSSVWLRSGGYVWVTVIPTRHAHWLSQTEPSALSFFHFSGAGVRMAILLTSTGGHSPVDLTHFLVCMDSPTLTDRPSLGCGELPEIPRFVVGLAFLHLAWK